jgi:hypothetical protein
MAEIVGKIPFEHDGETFEVWVVRDSTAWEFKVFVRKDGKPIALVWKDQMPARMTYSVSFETELDARMVMQCSAVAQAVETAKADLKREGYRIILGESDV